MKRRRKKDIVKDILENNKPQPYKEPVYYLSKEYMEQLDKVIQERFIQQKIKK